MKKLISTLLSIIFFQTQVFSFPIFSNSFPFLYFSKTDIKGAVIANAEVGYDSDGKITITPKTLYVNNSEAQKIHIELDTNTILLSINGTLGKTAVYNNEKVVLGKSACYCKLTNKLNVVFVLSLMNTNTFKCFLESNSSKSTIKNVGLKAIRNYKVILPPLPLQQEFASKIEAIERQKTLIQQSIDETQTLFDSRMDYWFG